MASRRSLIIALVVVVLFAGGRAVFAAGVTIEVTQVRASQGTGQPDIDRRLGDLRKQLSALPYKRFQFVGKFTGKADFSRPATIALAGGMRLLATPRREGGKRIGLEANLYNGKSLLLRTSVRVQPGRYGFIMCPAGNSATILAIMVK